MRTIQGVLSRLGPIVAAAFLLLAAGPVTAAAQRAAKVPVTLDNFIRAETDLYFGRTVQDGGFGKLRHRREMAAIDHQDVVRMNRDTLYSSGVFDLEASSLTVTLPDAGRRFMSMQVVSEDHYTTEVVYAPGRHTYTKEKVGTRYVFVIVRTLADPQNPADVKAANAVQDAIIVEQAGAGTFEVPDWDLASQDKVRDALNVLATMRGNGAGAMFGTKSEVDPVAHLIGTAIGWGGNLGAFTIQFGDCRKDMPNCLPIMAGWNYTVRLYRPRTAIVDGTWTFPQAQPVN